jgi:hypothetical protein
MRHNTAGLIFKETQFLAVFHSLKGNTGLGLGRENEYYVVRFQVLTAMKIVFSDVASCSLIETD